MSEVIYRKYRPQKFSDLVNQEHIRTTIENEIKTGSIAHAYLFSGPRGIGKTTTARLIAKSINCQNRKEGESEPCNKCNHCQAVITGNFLDLIEIDAASNRGIDEIRELRERVRFSPSNGKYKVFIIDEVHMLTTEAFNALLKTLEEPPAHAIFILATTEPHKIPDTIISRCQRFDFKKVTVKELVKRLQKLSKLEEVEVAPEVLETIAIRSGGCIRDAESLLQQVLSLGEKKIGEKEASLVIPRSDQNLVIQFIQNIIENNIKSSLELIQKLTIEGVDLERFVSDTIEFLRKILVYKSNASLELDLTKESEEKLKTLASQINNLPLVKLIELFLAKRKDIRQTEIPQLPLELLVLEFCESNKDVVNKVVNKVDKVNNTDEHEEKKIISNFSETEKAGQQSQPKARLASKRAGLPLAETINNSETTNTNIEELKEKWSNVLAEVQSNNQSICAFLKTGHIICINEDILELGFPYKFHQDTIKEDKNRKIIEDCISKITGQKLRLEVKHIEASENNSVETPREAGASPSENKNVGADGHPPSSDTNVMNDMLAEFGGEVVE